MPFPASPCRKCSAYSELLSYVLPEQQRETTQLLPCALSTIYATVFLCESSFFLLCSRLFFWDSLLFGEWQEKNREFPPRPRGA